MAMPWLQIATISASVLLAGWLGFRMERLLERDAATRDDLVARRAFAWNLSGRTLMEASWFMLGFTVFRFQVEALGAPVWFTPLYLGLLVLVYGVGSFIWGTIADRVGQRRQLMMLGCAAIVGLMVPMPFVGLVPFVLLSLLQTTMLGCMRIPFALASEWTPDFRGEAIGLVHAMGWMLAVGVGAVVGGMYQRHGMLSAAIVGGLFYAAAAVCFYLMRDARVDAVSANVARFELRGLFQFESPWPMRILAVVLLISIPRGAIVLNSLNYIEKTGFDLEFLFIMEAWALALNVVLFTYAGVICDRFGAEIVLTASGLLYFVFWALFAIGLPAPLAVAIYLFPVVGLLYTSSDALLARHTTLEERNRGVGISGAVVFFGQFVGSASAALIMMGLSGSMGAVDQYLWSFRIMVPLLAVGTFLGWRLTQHMAADSDVLEAEIAA
jgi:MFS family permease